MLWLFKLFIESVENTEEMLEGYRRKMERYIKSIAHEPPNSHFLTLESINSKIIHEANDIFSMFHLLTQLYHHAQDYELNRIPVVRRICLLAKNSFGQNNAYGSKIDKLVLFSTQSLLLWRQSLRSQLESHNYRHFRQTGPLFQHETAQYYYFCLSIYNEFINTNSLIKDIKPEHKSIFHKQNIKQNLLAIRKSIALLLQETQHENHFKIKLAMQFCVFNANWVKVLSYRQNGKASPKEIEIYYINTLKSIMIVVKLIQKFRHRQFNDNFRQLKHLIRYVCHLYHSAFQQQLESFCWKINSQLEHMCEENTEISYKYSGEKKTVQMAEKFRNAWILLNRKRINEKKERLERQHQKLVRSASKKRRSLFKKESDIEKSQKFEINHLKNGKSKSLYLQRNSMHKSSASITKDDIKNSNALAISINPIKPQFINRLRNRAQSAKAIPLNLRRSEQPQKQPQQIVSFQSFLKPDSKIQFKSGVNLQNKRRNLYLSIRC